MEEEAKEDRLLKKAMLEMEWHERREGVVEDMDTEDDTLVDMMAKQFRIMDIWMDGLRT